MTKRDELIEKVARAIFETWAKENNSECSWDELLLMQKKDGYKVGKEFYKLSILEAKASIDTIYAESPCRMRRCLGLLK